MPDPVIIVPYDPAWPAQFAAQCEKLRQATGLAVEHVGSTAVPGLAAKPIIDLLIGAPSEDLLDVTAEDQGLPGRGTAITPAGNAAHVALVKAIIGCGFTYRGVNGLPGRLYFSRQGAHLHLPIAGGWIAHDHLLFRDWLRSHPDDRRAYGALKRALARALGHDRAAYTTAKSDFIKGVLLRAGGIGPWLRESA